MLRHLVETYREVVARDIEKKGRGERSQSSRIVNQFAKSRVNHESIVIKLTTGAPAIFVRRLPERRGFGQAIADGSFQATHRSSLPAGEEFEALRPNRNCRWLGSDQAWSNFGAIRSSRS